MPQVERQAFGRMCLDGRYREQAPSHMGSVAFIQSMSVPTLHKICGIHTPHAKPQTSVGGGLLPIAIFSQYRCN